MARIESGIASITVESRVSLARGGQFRDAAHRQGLDFSIIASRGSTMTDVEGEPVVVPEGEIGVRVTATGRSQMDRFWSELRPSLAQLNGSTEQPVTRSSGSRDFTRVDVPPQFPMTENGAGTPMLRRRARPGV